MSPDKSHRLSLLLPNVISFLNNLILSMVYISITSVGGKLPKTKYYLGSAFRIINKGKTQRHGQLFFYVSLPGNRHEINAHSDRNGRRQRFVMSKWTLSGQRLSRDDIQEVLSFGGGGCR